MKTKNSGFSGTSDTIAVDGDGLIITRVFETPVDRVWKSWTDPLEVAKWWGPKDFTCPACSLNPRLGGTYLYCMRSPDGSDFWSAGEFVEFVPNKKLVFTNHFADDKGNIVPATHYGMSPEIPLEMVNTVLFDEHDGRTEITLKHAGMPQGTDREMAELGWKESLDKLAHSLQNGTTLFSAEPDRTDVVVERTFDASRDVVFAKFTKPDWVPLWWGPKFLKTTVKEMNIRPGGLWHIVQRDPNGREYGFHGVYHLVECPARIVRTFEYDGEPGHVMLETTRFDDFAGKTKITITSVFQTQADRDSMVKAGMESGANETMDRFADLLSSTR